MTDTVLSAGQVESFVESGTVTGPERTRAEREERLAEAAS